MLQIKPNQITICHNFLKCVRMHNSSLFIIWPDSVTVFEAYAYIYSRQPSIKQIDSSFRTNQMRARICYTFYRSSSNLWQLFRNNSCHKYIVRLTRCVTYAITLTLSVQLLLNRFHRYIWALQNNLQPVIHTHITNII